MPPAEETFWQKAWRFILGLLGLDSGKSGGEPAPEISPEEIPPKAVPGG
jgi:hypothetical protein